MVTADERSSSSITEDLRRDRHRHIREASIAALASPEFQRALAELKSRCAAARSAVCTRPQTDIDFDSDRERAEGWAFEPIGNVFA